MTENDDQILDEQVPEESVQLDQMESDRTLIDRGVRDPLDEGYIPPDDWSAGEGYGNTAAEMRQGETLGQRMKQELPDRTALEGVDDADVVTDFEIGRHRAGRLVDANGGYPGEDREPQVIAESVGIAGGAASAEEAAMHIIDEEVIEEVERLDDDERLLGR